MFCVIQEIPLKKKNDQGSKKRLETYTYKANGRTINSYRHSHDDKFDRPIQKAYKISVHQSSRVNGKVVKQQNVIGTWEHYHLCEYGLNLDEYPYCDKILNMAHKLGIDDEKLCNMIYKKVNPLIDRIRAEFQETEEYETSKKHSKILDEYRRKRNAFKKEYFCTDHEYDSCYDLYGNLTDKKYRDELKARAEAYNQEQEKQDEYYKQFHESIKTGKTNFTEYETEMLKGFYRTLSKVYHPDLKGGSEEAMQFLNKLKESWNI